MKLVVSNLISTFQYKMRMAGIESKAKGIGEIPRLKKYAAIVLVFLCSDSGLFLILIRRNKDVSGKPSASQSSASGAASLIDSLLTDYGAVFVRPETNEHRGYFPALMRFSDRGFYRTPYAAISHAFAGRAGPSSLPASLATPPSGPSVPREPYIPFALRQTALNPPRGFRFGRYGDERASRYRGAGVYRGGAMAIRGRGGYSARGRGMLDESEKIMICDNL